MAGIPVSVGCFTFKIKYVECVPNASSDMSSSGNAMPTLAGLLIGTVIGIVHGPPLSAVTVSVKVAFCEVRMSGILNLNL